MGRIMNNGIKIKSATFKKCLLTIVGLYYHYIISSLYVLKVTFTINDGGLKSTF